MPLSGSYHYPVTQKPNSSFPSIDLRDVETAPAASTGLGKFFVSGSEIYFRNENGNIESVTSQVLENVNALVLSGAEGVYVSSSLTVESAGTNIQNVFFGSANGAAGFGNSAPTTLAFFANNGLRMIMDTNGFRGSAGGATACRIIGTANSTDKIPVFTTNTPAGSGLGFRSNTECSLISANFEGIRVFSGSSEGARIALTGSVKNTTGDPPDPLEGEITINTADSVIKIWVDGAWRTLTTW